MVYPPKIIPVDPDEIKYFSTAAGNIIMLREQSQLMGMYYWRQY
jgi:hypothetical protein